MSMDMKIRPPMERKVQMRLETVAKEYRAPDARRQDYQEITPGFTLEEAIKEASRCLQCPEPACVRTCRLGNDIPLAMWFLARGDVAQAARVYRRTNPLPEICGRVCPPNDSCAAECILGRQGRPIDTRAIEAFVADFMRTSGQDFEIPKAASTGKKVAVIGSGPSGLLVTEKMLLAGHDVVVYDALPEPGGLLVYGIPGFKLEKRIVEHKVSWLEEMGAVFKTNTRVGKDISIDEMFEDEGFDAIYIGTGAQKIASMGLEGEDLGRVYSSLDFINAANLPQDYLPERLQHLDSIGDRVAVIGGGDTATDCLRTALRLGAKMVTCFYRRTEQEMPGNKVDRKYAGEEGAKFEFLTSPTRFLDRSGDGNVDAMEMIRMELGEPDASGRRRPVAVEGSEYIVDVDAVILAIGFWSDTTIPDQNTDIKTNKWGNIEVNSETGETTRRGIFAGGDAVSGPALVSEALRLSSKAADGILAYLAAD